MTRQILSALCAIILNAQISRAQTIGPDILVNNGSVTNVAQPQVAAFEDTLVAITAHVGAATRWSYSTNAGRTWIDGGALSGQNSPCDFPKDDASICVGAGGKFYAISEESRCSYGWGAIAFFSGSLAAGQFTWGPAKVLVPGSFLEDYDFVRIASDRDSNVIYVTFTRQTGPITGDPLSSAINLMRSTDGGVTWSAAQSLGSSSCNGGRVAVGPAGEVYVTWVDYATGQAMLVRSDDHGQTFGPASAVATLNDNLATGPPGYGAWNVPVPYSSQPTCWNAFYKGSPSLDIDRTTGPYRGRVYLTWAQHTAGTLSAQVDNVGGGGGWFSTARRAQPGSDISGSMGSSDNINSVPAYYFLDGSAGTTVEIIGIVTYLSRPSTFDCKYMELLAGPDTLQGQIVCVAHPLFKRGEMPPMIYTLPYTGRYYFKMSPSGSGYGYQLQLRKLVPSAGQAARDGRDIVMISSGDRGVTWTNPLLVNDSPPGFDECTPALSVDRFGKVNIAWYDRRDDSTGTRPNTYWTYSRNGGLTFEPSRRLSGQSGLATGWLVGDDMGIASGGTHVYCVWTDNRDGSNYIWGAPIDVSGTTPVLASGFEIRSTDTGLVATWDLEDVKDVQGFDLERARKGSTAYADANANVIPVHGTGAYLWKDNAAIEPGDYLFRLRLRLSSGGSVTIGPTSLHVPEIRQFRWVIRSANPFRSSVDLSIQLPRAGRVVVRVLATNGAEVARLVDERRSAGIMNVRWNGLDQRGVRAPSGHYILSANSGGETASNSVTLVR